MKKILILLFALIVSGLYAQNAPDKLLPGEIDYHVSYAWVATDSKTNPVTVLQEYLDTYNIKKKIVGEPYKKEKVAWFNEKTNKYEMVIVQCIDLESKALD